MSKFWICSVALALLPILLVVALWTLGLILYQDLGGVVRRVRAEMQQEQTKREGKMLIGLTPVPQPQPKRCVVCGALADAHARFCARDGSLLQPEAQETATGRDVVQEAARVARMENSERLLFETDLLLYSMDRLLCFSDVERRKLYEVAQRSLRTEMPVIRQLPTGVRPQQQDSQPLWEGLL